MIKKILLTTLLTLTTFANGLEPLKFYRHFQNVEICTTLGKEYKKVVPDSKTITLSSSDLEATKMNYIDTKAEAAGLKTLSSWDSINGQGYMKEFYNPADKGLALFVVMADVVSSETGIFTCVFTNTNLNKFSKLAIY